MKGSVAIIFIERPKQWGLRGDPYLWGELENYFASIHTPITGEEFHTEFYRAFEILTGERLEKNEYLHVSKYSYGGISSGMISGEFWIDTALPMRIERLKVMNYGIE